STGTEGARGADAGLLSDAGDIPSSTGLSGGRPVDVPPRVDRDGAGSFRNCTKTCADQHVQRLRGAANALVRTQHASKEESRASGYCARYVGSGHRNGAAAAYSTAAGS